MSRSFTDMLRLVCDPSVEMREDFDVYLNNIAFIEGVEYDLDETDMTPELEKKREEYVLELKDRESYFKKRYGDRWESVLYGTATNLAKKDLGI